MIAECALCEVSTWEYQDSLQNSVHTVGVKLGIPEFVNGVAGVILLQRGDKYLNKFVDLANRNSHLNLTHKQVLEQLEIYLSQQIVDFVKINYQLK